MMTPANAARPSPMPQLASYIAAARTLPLSEVVLEKAKFQFLDMSRR